MLVFNRQFQSTPVPVPWVPHQFSTNDTNVANNNVSSESGVSVYPNPVTEFKNAMLRFNKIDKGNYTVMVYDAKGQKLLSQEIQHDGGNNLYQLQSDASWAAGVYNITVSNTESGKSTTLQLIVSK